MTTRFHPITLGAPGEEISKKDLHAVSQRFKYFNQGRLQRVQDFFQIRQQDFLELLPLIFHINHPLLPGFVSLDTPAGIPDYTPGKQTIDTARQFSKGFVYKRKALKSYPIYGIFLMGSAGSMAFSKESDIDIWLCHQPGLDNLELADLQRKAVEVEKWAASLKIEVHFFLINGELFKQGASTPISVESSGTTQHYLLLEEFYRTSIYVAGRIPVWWLVPPAQEKHYSLYVAHLLENRFIAEQEVIDFGGLQNMPLAEFVSSTLWHIYKSLSSPHKSILKLLLMESYASEFPEPQWLCMALKQAIYQGDFSVDSLDPYLMIYGKVDGYLQKQGSERRLTIARECFHLKIMGIGNAALDNRARQAHESFLQSVAHAWHWPSGLRENISSQKFWTIHKASSEHIVIRDQLQHCLRIILKFVGNPVDHNYRENKDLRLISRKLQAALDQRPGKVEVLTTRSMVHALPDVLTFVEHEQGVWRLYADIASQRQTSPDAYLKQCDSLLELLCWSLINGLHHKNLNLKLQSSALQLNSSELNLLVNEFKRFLTGHFADKDESLEVFEKPNRFLSSLLLINLGENLALDANSQQFVMSERSDPFSYGENRVCLVQTVQKISLCSWGEVVLQSYRGLDGFFSCLCEVFNQGELPLAADKLTAVCLTKGRGRSIVWRINTLFGNLLECFSDRFANEQLRFVVAGEGGYCVFRCRDHVLSFYMLENVNQLLQELGSAQPRFSPVTFDAYVLEQTFIPALYSQNLADTIQVFYHVAAKHVAVYVIDEKGALFIAQHSSAQAGHVLIQYSAFLGALLVQAKLPHAHSVKCYEIQKNSHGAIACLPVQVKPEDSALDLRVRICYEQSTANFVVFCNDRKFSIVDAETYKMVKSEIQSYRRSRGDYPYHISEIDVPSRLLGIDDANQAQAVHYLRYKQKLEDKLNPNSSAEGLF